MNDVNIEWMAAQYHWLYSDLFNCRSLEIAVHSFRKCQFQGILDEMKMACSAIVINSNSAFFFFFFRKKEPTRSKQCRKNYTKPIFIPLLIILSVVEAHQLLMYLSNNTACVLLSHAPTQSATLYSVCRSRARNRLSGRCWMEETHKNER